MKSRERELFYIGTHPNSFRSGEPALIERLEAYEGKSGKIIPCFVVRYADDFLDVCPISDHANYKVVTGNEISYQYTLKGE